MQAERRVQVQAERRVRDDAGVLLLQVPSRGWAVHTQLAHRDAPAGLVPHARPAPVQLCL